MWHSNNLSTGHRIGSKALREIHLKARTARRRPYAEETSAHDSGSPRTHLSLTDNISRSRLGYITSRALCSHLCYRGLPTHSSPFLLQKISNSLATVVYDDGAVVMIDLCQMQEQIRPAICGIYLWEFLLSLDFEWSFITRRKKFSWPMIPYFAGRYACLAMLITFLVAANINISNLGGWSGGASITISFLTQAAITFASANLAIRTMIVWGMRLYIVIPLVLILLGQWGVLYSADAPTGISTPFDPSCYSPILSLPEICGTFVYTLCFDFIVFSLSAWKLASPRRRVSQVIDLLFKDGLIYFVLIGFVNILAIILSQLDVNVTVLGSFATLVPVISTIVASRAVRRLSNFSASQPAIYLLTQDRLVLQSNSTPTPGPNLNLRAASPAVREVRSPVATFHIDISIGGDDADTHQVDEETGIVTAKLNSDCV